MRIVPCTIHGKPRWRLIVWSAGKRQRRIFKTEAAAKKALREIQKDQDAIGRGFRVLTPAQKSEVAVILEEMRRAGTTLRKVWDAWVQIPSGDQAVTLGKAIEELLLEKEQANRRPRHISSLRWYLTKFAEGRPFQPVHTITHRVLLDWFKHKESPGSRKKHYELLSALFSFCVRRGYMSGNPIKRLEPIHVDREVPAILTYRQCQQAIAFAHCRCPQLLAWLTLALFCGLRPEAECDKISWEDIHLKKGRLIVPKSKVRQPRVMELDFCPPALAWLQHAKELGSPLAQPYGVRREYFHELRKRLGAFPPDTLRHTCASNLLAYYQDAAKVASWMGNSPGVLLKHYKALVFKEDAARFMRLLPKA